MASIFDNLDLSGVDAGNPFAFMAGQGPGMAAALPGAPPPTAPPLLPPPGAAQAGFLGPSPDMSTPGPDAGSPSQNGMGGLLSRLMAPSEDGITFNDKLMALGHILKGQGDEAGKYLENRRAALEKGAAADQKTKDAEAKQKQAAQMAQVFATSFDDKGNFLPQAYAQKAAALNLSPSSEDLIKAMGLRTKYEPQNMGGRYGVQSFNPYDQSVKQVVEGQGAPAPYGWEGGQPTADFLKGTTAVNAAQRAGKPLAPRVGRTGATSKPPAALLAALVKAGMAPPPVQ